MDEYTVELKRSADKELARLPSDVLSRMVAKLGVDYRAVYVVDELNDWWR